MILSVYAKRAKSYLSRTFTVLSTVSKSYPPSGVFLPDFPKVKFCPHSIFSIHIVCQTLKKFFPMKKKMVRFLPSWTHQCDVPARQKIDKCFFARKTQSMFLPKLYRSFPLQSKQHVAHIFHYKNDPRVVYFLNDFLIISDLVKVIFSRNFVHNFFTSDNSNTVKFLTNFRCFCWTFAFFNSSSI